MSDDVRHLITGAAASLRNCLGGSGMNDGPSIPSGIWRSVYTYESSSRGRTFTDERDVLIHTLRTQMMAISLDPESPRLRMNLSTAGRLVMASWTERTDPDGYYAGAMFQGVAQFILAEDGLSMSGAWAGHSRDMSAVNTGPWTLAYVEPWPGDLPQSVPEAAERPATEAPFSGKRNPVDGWSGDDGFPVPI